MANESATSKLRGNFGDSNKFTVTHVLAGTVASTETLALTLPEGLPDAAIPTNASVWTDATPSVKVVPSAVSHNRTTRVTTLTAPAAGFPTGAKCIVEYEDVASF